MLNMVGQLLAGRYRLEEPIATGGMGTVWRARDEVLHRPVAVKLLHDALAEDEKAAARFRREALTAAQIHHPNMASVFDYVEEDGRPGIVMELVESETLAQRLARHGPLPLREAVHIAASVLSALETAHVSGVVHRDIKPGNILLSPDGTVKVTDFGIARSLGDASLTATGTVMGTPHYSAPEQVRGESATAATDIYSVGIVLYEMLTGHRPFEADTAIAVAMARLSEDPPPVRSLRADVPPSLEAIVVRALARDPAERFETARAMREALLAADTAAATGTLALPLDGHSETISLRAPAPVPVAADTASPLEEVAPPRWAWRKLALVLLPLLLIAVLSAALLAAASGPDMVALPNLVGMKEAEAKEALQRLGLPVQRRWADSDRARGSVIRQDPQPRQVEEGTTVTLSVSDGTCCKVPRIVGMTEARARAALAAEGLRVGQTFVQRTRTERSGTVVAANPGPGSEVKDDAAVTLYIAKPPEPPREEKGEGKGDEEKGGGKGKDDDDD